MTALSTASDEPGLVATAHFDYCTQLIDHVRLKAAVERAGDFWAPVEPQRAVPGGPAAPGPGSLRSDPRRLMRRVAGDPAVLSSAYDRHAPALVELRGPAELDLAYQLLAAALDAPAEQVVPHRTTAARPEPLHLRTWALFGHGDVLCCAMTVCVGNVLVVRALATRPSHQAKGYATGLLRALHDLHERTGVVTDFAVAAPEGRCGLFERLGYRAVEPTAGWGRSVTRPGPQRLRRTIEPAGSHRRSRRRIGS